MTLKKLVFLVSALGTAVNQIQERTISQIPVLTEVCSPVVLIPIVGGLVFAEHSFFISRIYNKNPLNFGDMDFCLLNTCLSLIIAHEIVMNKNTIIDLFYTLTCVMGLHCLMLASKIEWFMPCIPFCTISLRKAGSRSLPIWTIFSFVLHDFYRIKLQSITHLNSHTEL